MRVVVDTNVLMSGIFYSGPPYEILSAWRHGIVTLVISAEIFDEYRRVGERLASRYPGVDIGPILALIAVHAELVEVPRLCERICEDPSDDKFFACAIAAGCRVIVSGDRHLHKASGYSGVEVDRPREFLEKRISQ